MMDGWRRIKPGWYLLVILLIYSLLVSIVAARQGERVEELQAQLSEAQPEEQAGADAPAAARQETDQPALGPALAVNDGLWLPLPGARLPQDPSHLPNSPRPYRQGVSQGFDFYSGDSGVPVPYGAAVIASAPGRVVRADHDYVQEDPEAWAQLMEEVADGASDDQLDRLRGRQVWIETEDGRLLRYAHLSAIRDGLAVGQRVIRGQVVGFVGNSGTDEGAVGSEQGARLHFEVWDDEEFFGEGMEPEEILIAAVSLFTGP